MRKDPLSTDEFNEKKNMAKEVEPKVITTFLSNIFLEPESFDKRYILLFLEGKKRRVNVSTDFFKDLSKILNITQSLRKSLSDGEDNNSFYSIFLDKLKDVQNAVGGISEITLLYNVILNKITNIKKGRYGRLTNDALFDFAAGLVNQYPELSIIEANVSNQSPDVNIKLLSSNVFDFSDELKSNDSEEFKFGITVSNSGFMTKIGDFAWRMVCTNGMFGIRTDERFTLPNTETDGLRQLFDYFTALKEQKFLPQDFAENAATATQVHASLRELEDAYKLVAKNLILDYPEQGNLIREALSDKYFEDLKRVYARIKLKGFNPAKLENEEKSFIRTNTTIWDMINTLTDLGSNDHGVFKFSNRDKFQAEGGRIMTRIWDLKNEKWLLL